MVGYNLSSKSKLSTLDYAIAGAGSGFITRLLCQPFDVLKIRFQLQVEPVKRSTLNIAKYQSTLQSLQLIIKEEGIRALWKGHVPGQLLSIIYGPAQFTTFEVLTEKASYFQLKDDWDPAINFVCGSIAGCVATFVSFPFDVVRTRLVAQSEQNRIYSGIIDAFKSICRNEGYFVLFRGLLPTLIQIAPHGGVQFMTYKLFHDAYKKIAIIEHTTLSSTLVAGSLAGLCAKTAIYPLDLAKKRLQIQGFQDGREFFGKTFVCKGLKDCLLKIYRVEGFLGFFKGLSPSLLKAVLASASHFSCYEMICRIFEMSR